MLRYKAGYKFVAGGVHAQVLDFPAAITCATISARGPAAAGRGAGRCAEAAMEMGQPLPVPNPLLCDPEMDVNEPIDMHFHC